MLNFFGTLGQYKILGNNVNFYINFIFVFSANIFVNPANIFANSAIFLIGMPSKRHFYGWKSKLKDSQ